MKKMIYAITGANGQLGSFLVEYLRNLGHEVYELARSPEKVKDIKYYKFFDLGQPQQIPPLQGIDVLIHTAYFFDTAAKDYESINITGTQQLFHKARINNVKFSIFISTISAYSEAHSLYGRTKFQLEQLLIKENSRVITIRPGLIFHEPLKGITSVMERFVKKFPIVPLIGNGNALIYPCRLEELAQLIYTLSIKQPEAKLPIIACIHQ